MVSIKDSDEQLQEHLRKSPKAQDSPQKEENVKTESVQVKPPSKVKQFLAFILEKLDFLKFTINQIKKESFGSLFNGLSSAILLSVVQNSTYFCWTKILSIVSEKLKYSNSIGNSLLISLLSALITSVCINPVSVVNARMTQSSEKVNYLLIYVDWK